jgi:hypothetical protein
VPGYDRQGRKTLLDANTGKVRPWPLLGVTLVGDPPKMCVIPMRYVSQIVGEGWCQRSGEQAIHKPGGPPEDPWRKTHTFIHADTITFKLIEGDVVYRVVQQPDKIGEGGSAVVTWDYVLELENHRG